MFFKNRRKEGFAGVIGRLSRDYQSGRRRGTERAAPAHTYLVGSENELATGVNAIMDVLKKDLAFPFGESGLTE